MSMCVYRGKYGGKLVYESWQGRVVGRTRLDNADMWTSLIHYAEKLFGLRHVH